MKTKEISQKCPYCSKQCDVVITTTRGVRLRTIKRTCSGCGYVCVDSAENITIKDFDSETPKNPLTEDEKLKQRFMDAVFGKGNHPNPGGTSYTPSLSITGTRGLPISGTYTIPIRKNNIGSITTI